MVSLNKIFTFMMGDEIEKNSHSLSEILLVSSAHEPSLAVFCMIYHLTFIKVNLRFIRCVYQVSCSIFFFITLLYPFHITNIKHLNFI